MRTQTITKEQAQSFIDFVKKAWDAIKKAVQKAVQFIMRAVRKASIKELEERAKLPDGGINCRCSMTPFGEALRQARNIRRVGTVPKTQELGRLKGYDAHIQRLEGIQRRTLKHRIKKKLQKRISKLQSKSLKTAGRYL